MAAKRDKQAWVLFITTFLISLIVITYFIKSMSPDVDVEIAGEHIEAENATESDIKQAIDDRLRWIQMEDNMPGVSKREDGTDNENIEETQKKEQQKGEELAPIEYVNPQSQKEVQLTPPTPAIPAKTVETQASKAEPFKMAKVYVGSYSTIEQAIQAQNKLMGKSTSVSPFVKEVNGTYVLQAGSYANATKAESLAKEINSLGFNARVVKE